MSESAVKIKIPQIKTQEDLDTILKFLTNKQPQTIGEKLKYARIISNHTAKEICNNLNINNSLFSRYEKDKVKNINYDMLRKIALYCGLDENYFE